MLIGAMNFLGWGIDTVEMTGPHKDVSKQKDKENKMPTQQSL